MFKLCYVQKVFNGFEFHKFLTYANWKFIISNKSFDLQNQSYNQYIIGKVFKNRVNVQRHDPHFDFVLRFKLEIDIFLNLV